jgi:hypothetical protein
MQLFVQDESRGQCGQNEAQCRQRPDQAHIALGQQIKQRTKEHHLQSDPRQDAGIEKTATHHACHLGKSHPLRLADLLQAAAEKDDADGFHDQRGDQDDQDFGHVIDPGSGSASRRIGR